MAKASVLGRGLGALLGEIEEAYENELPKKNGVAEILIGQIRPNPYQPRKHFDPESLTELSESIKTHGLLQPIVIKEDLDGYVLIAGERRLRATKLAKLKTIKAIIVSASHEQMREHALIENIQRDELNAIDLAQAYHELISIHELTHEQLSNTVHKSRTHITNTLRLLQLSNKGQKALVEGKITAGHAKILVGMETKEQELVIDSILGQKLSVRDVEQMVKKMKAEDAKSSVKINKEFKLDLEALRMRLDELGIKSFIKESKLTLTFDDNTQVDTFLARLSS